MDILRPATKNKTERLANFPLVGTQLWFWTRGRAVAYVPPSPPQKEILIPTCPHDPLPANIPELPRTQPSTGHPVCKSKDGGLCTHTDSHACTHTHAQSDALVDQANWPFPITPIDLDREGDDYSAGKGQALESPENSQPPSRLQPAQQFAFQWPPLSLPLRRPYLQGECESLQRRKPFGDARLGNNFASESKLVFGVNPSVETLG